MKKLFLGLATFGVGGFLLSMGTASAQPSISHAPMIRAKVTTSPHGNGNGNGHGHGGGGGGSTTSYAWESSNWSGYALSSKASGAYHDITGTWTVPSVTSSKKSTYSSTWVGIDGFTNSNLIQTGTEQDYSYGSAHYYAWWEILPAAETKITTATNSSGASVPATVQPGDTMYAHITQDSGSNWTITIQDQSQGWTSTTKTNYTGPATSAEWIEEAPTVGGHVATLANYGQTNLDPDTVNGFSPQLDFTTESGAMVQKHSLVSVPSQQDHNSDGFNVAYGSKSPAAPSNS